MVSQLEGSVLTAIALVMIVVLAALGAALRAAGRLCDPDVVPAVLCLSRGHGGHDLEHRHVRPDPGRRHAGRRRHRGRRIRRQTHPGRLGPDARLYRSRQAHVLADRLLDRHDALRLPADAVLARCARPIHGHAAGHADLRADRLARRRAYLPARHGRRRRPHEPRL